MSKYNKKNELNKSNKSNEINPASPKTRFIPRIHCIKNFIKIDEKKLIQLIKSGDKYSIPIYIYSKIKSDFKQTMKTSVRDIKSIFNSSSVRNISKALEQINNQNIYDASVSKKKSGTTITFENKDKPKSGYIPIDKDLFMKVFSLGFMPAYIYIILYSLIHIVNTKFKLFDDNGNILQKVNYNSIQITGKMLMEIAGTKSNKAINQALDLLYENSFITKKTFTKKGHQIGLVIPNLKYNETEPINVNRLHNGDNSCNMITVFDLINVNRLHRDVFEYLLNPKQENDYSDRKNPTKNVSLKNVVHKNYLTNDSSESKKPKKKGKVISIYTSDKEKKENNAKHKPVNKLINVINTTLDKPTEEIYTNKNNIQNKINTLLQNNYKTINLGTNMKNAFIVYFKNYSIYVWYRDIMFDLNHFIQWREDTNDPIYTKYGWIKAFIKNITENKVSNYKYGFKLFRDHFMTKEDRKKINEERQHTQKAKQQIPVYFKSLSEEEKADIVLEGYKVMPDYFKNSINMRTTHEAMKYIVGIIKGKLGLKANINYVSDSLDDYYFTVRKILDEKIENNMSETIIT